LKVNKNFEVYLKDFQTRLGMETKDRNIALTLYFKQPSARIYTVLASSAA